MSYFEKAIDTLDAHVFTGDAVLDNANRELLKEHCERWLRALEDTADLVDGAADEALARIGRQAP
jgi:hypothetical protein